MAHQTYYQKYRSKNFSELVGQSHVKQTLENAIEFDRVPHALIFSGPRGTGKNQCRQNICKVTKLQTGCLKDTLSFLRSLRKNFKRKVRGRH